MALKPLASITTVADVLAYAQAEAADAQSKCPTAYPQYVAAVQLAQNGGDVETVRQTILAARQIWYAAGCGGAGAIEAATSGQSVVPETEAGGGAAEAGLGGGIGTLLLVGAGVFGLLWFLDKKRKGGKTSARRKTTRRSAPRRRRASRRRR